MASEHFVDKFSRVYIICQALLEMNCFLEVFLTSSIPQKIRVYSQVFTNCISDKINNLENYVISVTYFSIETIIKYSLMWYFI